MRFLAHLNQDKYPLYIPKCFYDSFITKEVNLNFNPFNSEINSRLPIPFINMKSAVFYSLNEPLLKTFTVKSYHSNVIARASEIQPNADAQYIVAPFSNLSSIFQGKEYMAIQTADCLAVVFSFENNEFFIGAITHAGWRGYSTNILQNTIQKLVQEAVLVGISPFEFLSHLKIHIAPAIFGVSYECGENVENALIQHGKKLFSNYPDMSNYYELYSALMNVRSDSVLCEVTEKFLLQNQQSSYVPGKIFPDLQLLGALECFVSGVQSENIEILRENTYSHPDLYSFREVTHKKLDANYRQWTHLRFPKLDS